MGGRHEPEHPIRESALLYPIISGFHLLAIALFGGMVVMTDLRLLGWAMQRRKVSYLVGQLRVWKRAGFGLVVSSGLLLAWGLTAEAIPKPLVLRQDGADGAGGCAFGGVPQRGLRKH